MDIIVNTSDSELFYEIGELFYEIGDWANTLPLDKLVNKFSKLPKQDRDVIIAAVIGYIR